MDHEAQFQLILILLNKLVTLKVTIVSMCLSGNPHVYVFMWYADMTQEEARVY